MTKSPRIEADNAKLEKALGGLESELKSKIDQIHSKNQEILRQTQQNHNAIQSTINQKAQILSANNDKIKSSGSAIISEIKSDLEKIKNIINN
jgi:hypothetical protein